MFTYKERKYLTAQGIPIRYDSKPKATYPVRNNHHIQLYSNLSDDAFGLSGGFRDIALGIYTAKRTILLSAWLFHPEIHLPFFGKQLGDGLILHQQNNADCITHYQAVGIDDPDYPNAQYFLAIFYAQQNNLTQAFTCIEQALEKKPKQPLYLFVLIELYLSQNNLDAAEKNVKIYESLTYSGYYYLAQAHIHTAKYDLKKAKWIYQKLLKNDVHCIMAYQGLLAIALIEKDAENIQAQAIAIRNFQPQHPLARQILIENKSTEEISIPHPFFNFTESYVAFMQTLPTLGELLIEKATKNPDMLIAIQVWDRSLNLNYPSQVTAYMNRYGNLPGNLSIQFVNCTFGRSQHQKMLILDDDQQNLHAFYGSADLAIGKFDWNEHPLINTDNNQGAAFNVYRTFQGEQWRKIMGTNLRMPWHEMQAHVRGAVVSDMAQEFAKRWQSTNSSWFANSPAENRINLHLTKHYSNPPHSPSGIWQAQLLISSAEKTHEKSIHKALLQAIYFAKEYIYLESQYFTQMEEDAHNRIPNALVEKIILMHQQGKPFHVYLALPLIPNGEPGNVLNVEPVRELQFKTITRCMRAIEAATGVCWTQYMSVISFAKWHGVANSPAPQQTRAGLVQHNARYPVYIHSKCAIFDNTNAIIGSANLNERSLDGRTDSEIAIYQFPEQNQEAACTRELRIFMLEKIIRPYFGLEIYNELNAQNSDILPLNKPEMVQQIRIQANSNLFAYTGHDPTDHSNPNTGLIVSLPFAQEKNQIGQLMPGISPFMPDAPNAIFSNEPADIYRWFGSESLTLKLAQTFSNSFARLFS